jgi:hypothetical protein
MARCASEFEPELLAKPVELSVSFKLPVFMPAWVLMERWESGGGQKFTLRDTQGDKPHLTGSLLPLSARKN